MRLFVLPDGSTPGQTLEVGSITSTRPRRREIPREIFIEILLIACNYVEADSGCQLSIPKAQDLLKLSLVCKGWYNTISSTPSFWTTFAKGTDPRALFAHLSHTSNAPLTFIRFSLTKQPLPPLSLHFILSQLARLKVLRLAVTDYHLHFLSANLSRAAPSLVELELYLPGNGMTKPLSLPDSLFQGGCPPLLKRLRLTRYQLSWTSPLFSSTLTELSLDSQSPFASSEEFCKVIGRLQNLRELTLLGCCLPPPTTSAVPKFELPRLSHLSLSDDAVYLTGALKCFTAHLLYLSVTCYSSKGKIRSVLNECLRLLDPHIPLSPGPSINFCSGLNLDITSHPDLVLTLELCLDVEARDGTTTYGSAFEARFHFDDETDSALDIDVALRTCLDELPLLSDTVTFYLAHQPDNPAPYWLDYIGTSLWSLETIVIAERAAYLDFLKVYKLYLERLDPETPKDKQVFSKLVSILYQESILDGIGIGETQEEFDVLHSIRSKRSTLQLPDIVFRILEIE